MKKGFKIFIYLLVFVPLIFAVQSCNSKKDLASNSSNNSGTQKVETIDGTWVLRTFNGQNSKDIFPRRTPIVSIDTKTNQITGNGGCNGMSGMFTYKNGTFSAPNMISTMMFCEDAPQESQLMKILSEECVVKAVNGVLTFSQKGKVIAKFVRGIDSQLLLGAWVLNNLEGKKVATLTQNVPTMEFSSEENISGFAGCNRYSSTIEIDGNAITFGPILTTRMACENMDIETLFVKALSQANTINVSNDTLTLSVDGKVLLVFTK